ncbi:hypothetical protein [Neobacillus bataviensis]
MFSIDEIKLAVLEPYGELSILEKHMLILLR